MPKLEALGFGLLGASIWLASALVMQIRVSGVKPSLRRATSRSIRVFALEMLSSLGIGGVLCLVLFSGKHVPVAYPLIFGFIGPSFVLQTLSIPTSTPQLRSHDRKLFKVAAAGALAVVRWWSVPRRVAVAYILFVLAIVIFIFQIHDHAIVKHVLVTVGLLFDMVGAILL